MDIQPQVNGDLLNQAIDAHKSSMVPILHQIQDYYGYLPEMVIKALSGKTGVPLSEIYRVATFYSSFSLKPRGKHQIVMCSGTSCHVRGSGKIIKEVKGLLGIEPGEVTSDGEFSIETVNCLGCCAFAPVMVVDGHYYGHLNPAKAREIIKSMQQGKEQLEVNHKKEVSVSERRACEA